MKKQRLLLLIGLLTMICTGIYAQPVSLGSYTGSSASNVLFSTSTGGNNLSQSISIYTAEEIHAAGGVPGLINKIAWFKEGGDYANQTLLEVYIKHTTLSNWTTHTGDVIWATEVTGATQVYANNAWFVPNGEGWKDITLTTPFNWNGTDNIAIYTNFSRPGANPTTEIRWGRSTTNLANSARVGSGTLGDLLKNNNRPIVQLQMSPTREYNAGIYGIESQTFCAGQNLIKAKIRNNGSKKITDLVLNGETDGIPFGPINLSLLTVDTINGTGIRDTAVDLTNLFVNNIGIQKVKAWITSINTNKNDSFRYDDTLSIDVRSAMTGPYTIGGSGASFSDMQQAISSLELLGVCGPVTFSIAAGTYPGRSIIKEIQGASSTNTITFIGAGKTTTILTNTATGTSDLATLTLDGADYLTFRDLTIESPFATHGVGIMLGNSADYNQFRNVRVQMNPNSTNINTSGILFTNNFLSYAGYGNTGNNNIFDSVDVDGAYYGVRFNGSTAAGHVYGNSFINGTITNQSMYGIYAQYVNTFNFSNNKISGIRNATGYGLQLTDIANYTVTNNVISSTGYGIRLNSSNVNNHNPLYRTLVANNIAATSSSASGYCLEVSGSKYVHILHNTLQSNATGQYATAYFTTSDNIDFRNNILVNNSIGSNNHTVYYTNTAFFDSLDHNNYYSPSGMLVYLTATQSYANLAAWKVAVPQFNQNSYAVNPLFVSSTDFGLSLASPSLYGIYAGVDQDIDGKERSKSSPTAGAKEAVPVPVNASVAELVSPAGFFCKGNHEVKVKIRNKGNTAMNNVTLKWEIDGSTANSSFINGIIDTLGSTAGNDTIVSLGMMTFDAGVAKNLRVWTEFPGGAPDPVNGDDTLYAKPMASLSDTITVGGSSPTFATVADAVSAIKNVGICGPVLVEIRPGTYTGKLILEKITGASASSTLTFKGSGKNNTIVTDNSTGGTFVFRGTNYVTLRDMTIQAQGTADACAVLLTNNSSFNQFINLNIRVDSTATVSSIAGIGLSGASSSLLSSGISGSDNKFDSLRISGGYYGIYITGLENSLTGQVFRNSVTNSVFVKQTYYGIYSYYHNDFKFEHNTISNMRNPLSNGLHPQYCANYSISYNKIIANTGMYPYSTNKVGYNGVRSRISNNMIIAGTNHGILMLTADSVEMIHNTIISSGINTNTPINIGSSTFGMICRNNILVNRNPAANAYAINIATTAGITALDNNNYYSVGGGILYESASINYATLAAWKTAKPAFNQNSFSVEPLFVSLTDLHLKPLGTILRGADLGITTDIDGKTRLNPPAIGAHERSPYMNSAGVSEITPRGFCAGTYPVFAKVSNTGFNKLTSLTINWELDGQPQTPISITTPIDTFGSAAGGDQMISLGSHTFTQGIGKTIKVWVSQPNGTTDPFTNDDTLTSVLKTGLGGYYVIGGPGANYSTVEEAVEDLNQSGLCAPTTFSIQPGNYTGQLRLENFYNSDPDNNSIVFEGQVSDSTLVNINWPASDVNTNNYVVLLEGSRNVSFRYITFERTDSAEFTRIVQMNNTNDIQFRNNRFMAAISATTDADGNRASIFSNDVSREDSTVIENNLFHQNGNGVLLFSSLNSRAQGTVVNGNIFTTSYLGVWLKHHKSPSIQRNQILRTPVSTDFFGISLENCDSAFHVVYNKIVFDRGIGLRFIGCKGRSASAINVYNNTISGLTTTNQAQGISIESNNTYNSEYINVLHNTVRVNSSNATTGRTINMAGTATSKNNNINITRNILMNIGAGYVYYTGANSIGTNLVINYNNVFANGVNLGTWNSTTGIANDGLRSWMAQSGSDSLSTNVDVTFNNDNDLYITGTSSGDFNLAAPVSAVTNDIAGNARSGTYFYKGAHEPNSLNNSNNIPDAGLWTIVSPGDAVLLAGNHNLTFRVRNNSLWPITNFDYNYALNGTPSTTNNHWSGTLLPGKDTLLTISSAPIPAGTHELKIWVFNVNGSSVDLNRLNDTLSRSVTASAPLMGTFKVGTGETYANLTAVSNTLRTSILGGDVTFELTSNYTSTGETFPIVFSATTPATYKITIRPEAGVTSTVTTGDPLTAPLIDLDGASNFTFDGRAGGTGNTVAWTIRNTTSSTAATRGSTIRLINDASNNTLQYLQVEGHPATGFALVHFSTSTSGNNNNLVAFNTLRDRTDVASPNTAAQAVYSNGVNANNTIKGNRIFNMNNNGISVTGTNGSNWIVDSNHVYYNRSNIPTAGFSAISLLGSAGTTGYVVSRNYIGGSDIFASGASWKNSGAVTFIGIELTAYNNVLISNNVINNIEMTNTGTAVANSLRAIDFARVGAKVRIINNTISNLITRSRRVTFDNAASYAFNGIRVTAADSATISNNTIHTIEVADNSVTTAITLAGISVSNPAYVMINGNRIYNLLNRTQNVARTIGIISSNVPSGGIHHINNNSISLDASTTTGLYGIMHGGTTAAQTGNINVMNNSIYLGGTPSSGTSPSFGIYRSLSTPFTMRNNLVYFERSGAGVAMRDTVQTNMNADYNFYIQTNNAFTTGLTNMNFASWKTAGNDRFGYTATPAQIPSASLFTGVTTANLSPVKTNSNSWALNGKGISNIRVPADIEGNPRATTTGNPVDIGAHEFTPDASVEPVTVTVTPAAAPSVSTISVYNRPVATINWRSGTVPASLAVKYYSGVAPLNATIGNNINSYYSIEATGGSNYSYDMELAYTPAEIGTVAEADLTVAKKDGSSPWAHHPNSFAVVSNKVVKDTVQSGFSLFTLTSKNNPLPVKLVSFNAAKSSNNVAVKWNTASEVNASHFIIEASADGKNFNEVVNVKAKGKSSGSAYAYIHNNAQRAMQSSKIYYRLISVDEDGSSNESGIAMVNFGNETKQLDAVTAYPNPFSDKISLNIPQTGETMEITITDMEGRGIATYKVTPASSDAVELSMQQDLKQGIYFLKINSANESKVIKLIKH